MGYLLDSGNHYLLWFSTPSTDNRFVRYRRHRDGLLDKPVEEFATTAGRAPVEPKREFVQVIVKMFTTHRSLVSAEEPAFQQRRLPKGMNEYLNLTRLQIATIQTQIAEERGQVQPLVQQLARNRRVLNSRHAQGTIRCESGSEPRGAEQSRILEQLITANARLQTEVYKMLTIEQQRKLDVMRQQTVVSTKPSFTDW
jgi:hypothetical protein